MDDFVLLSVVFSILLHQRVSLDSVQKKIHVEYLDLSFFSLIISSVVSHFFANQKHHLSNE